MLFFDRLSPCGHTYYISIRNFRSALYTANICKGSVIVMQQEILLKMIEAIITKCYTHCTRIDLNTKEIDPNLTQSKLTHYG